MIPRLVPALVLGFATAALAAPPEPPPLRHQLHVTLDPAGHGIVVEDTMTWTGGPPPSTRDLAIAFPGASVQRADARTIVARYAGTIHDRLERPGEDYARGFAETSGTIEEKGVFLGGPARWYPAAADDRLVTFDLEIALPAGWDAMSQGRRVAHERGEHGTTVRFVCDDPQEEIWIVAGPWVETRRTSGDLEVVAMLREPDSALAMKYIDATGPYVAMYSGLLGRYPYGKFALVENFWDTGYGMPSFTLLGPAVIRLPFILTSSYPHEILHDWWGNGVYVDRRRGNWCEGLTAYLADHMFQEQRGAGDAYRQETLQKYADYVARSRDFPLTEFRERHSAATEAVGYGKSMMLFHMLRRELGDERFVAALKAVAAEFAFKRAGWDDLRRAFEKASGRDLARLVSTWIERTGAPSLRAREFAAAREGAGWRLHGTLVQAQRDDAFPLAVPVAVTLEGRPDATQAVVRCESKTCPVDLVVPARPLRADVDPEFDLFRTLDRREIPPALSTAFGADGGLAILPSSAEPSVLDAWRAMLSGWSRDDARPLRVVTDADVRELPADAPVWIVGWENRLLPEMAALTRAYGVSLSATEAKLEGGAIPRAGHAVCLVARNASRPDLPVTWVAADTVDQIPGLARKLPHYGKYSYLAFEGGEPTNVAKGRWPVVGSPLAIALDPARGLETIPRGRLAPRQPLAQVPPAYSESRMQATVGTLADPAAKGRGIGTPELDAVADTIAAAMKLAGLEPFGDAGGYAASWTESVPSLSRDVPLRNVLGILRGANPAFASEIVVVSAHYDHLGVGHPGADDNASGVAVLLELARVMAAAGPPPRSVVFAAFSGEESGLLGSRRFTATLPSDRKVFAAVNLDTVGRLHAGKLLVLGCSSADEWAPIASGAGYVTGVPVEPVPSDPGGSDQKTFQDAGIPAVQLFTGAHADYHGAGDTADKVDGPGLVKVASVAREFVAYLAERDRPLTAHAGAATGAKGAPPAPGTRRASLGAIPDYAFSGRGVRITGTMTGSGAEAAGLKAGDVIVGLGTAAIGSLSEYATALGAHAPGDRIKVTVLRDGAETSVEATLGAR